MTEDEELAAEEERAHLEWVRQQNEYDMQLRDFQDTCYEVSEQIDYLLQGYMPQAMMTPLMRKCVEAMTVQHIYQSYPQMEELRDRDESDEIPF
ncbi:MAG: hypothetical protein GY906_24710 [bacterium]|nr:hypothetical protein [bacterium]